MSGLSHRETVAQITAENRAYMAKLDEEQPLPKIVYAPSPRKAREVATFQTDNEIQNQKLKDAETVRRVLEQYRQQPIRLQHPIPASVSEVPQGSQTVTCGNCRFVFSVLQKVSRQAACCPRCQRITPMPEWTPTPNFTSPSVAPQQPQVSSVLLSPANADSSVAGKVFSVIIFGVVMLVVMNILFPSMRHGAEAQIEGYIDNQPYRLSVYNYLESHAHDPSSVEIVSLNPAARAANGTLMVDCHYRAKNGFGALVLGTETFVVDGNNNVISAQDYSQ